MGRRACNERPDGDPELCVIQTCDETMDAANPLTPHSEKHNMDLPSGAHSAFARPSAPASMDACQDSSRSLNTLTTPAFADAASTYSESDDQPACDIQDAGGCVVCLGSCLPACDGRASDGGSSCQVRVIWKESARRMTSRSCTAVRINWAPGLKATRDAVCL